MPAPAMPDPHYVCILVEGPTERGVLSGLLTSGYTRLVAARRYSSPPISQPYGNVMGKG